MTDIYHASSPKTAPKNYLTQFSLHYLELQTIKQRQPAP